MALAQTDLKLMYPQYVSTLPDDREGGYPSTNEWQEIETDKINLFNIAMLYSGTYVQYRKVFIRNDGDEPAQNVSIYGYNLNANSVVKMALERGQDQNIVYDGQEITVGTATKPNLYISDYNFQEILDISPLSLPDIPVGESVGIWLKLEFSSIDAFNENDSFILGLNFEGALATPFNIEKTVVHSRYAAAVNIIRVKLSNAVFRGVVVEFEPLDMSASGIEMNEAVYGLYIDRIFIKEHTGTNRIPVQLYGTSVPMTIEVFALPYSGYRPVLAALSAEFKNRLKISWSARNPDNYDVSKHVVYWDEATGTYKSVPIAVVDAVSGIGGGDKIENSQITN